MHRNTVNTGAVMVSWAVASLYMAKGARRHNFCLTEVTTSPQSRSNSLCKYHQTILCEGKTKGQEKKVDTNHL